MKIYTKIEDFSSEKINEDFGILHPDTYEKPDSETNIILNKIISRIEAEKNYYENPGGYQDEDYYIKCDAKVSVLEEVIDIVKQHLKI